MHNYIYFDMLTKSITFLKTLAILMSGMLFVNEIALGGFYKWVDADGKIHFSDRVPPNAAGFGRKVLDNEGVTTEVIKPPKTWEELREEQEKARQKAKLAEEQERRKLEARRLAAIERRKDEKLLRVFQSTDAIRSDRDDQIAAIDSQIVYLQRIRKKHQEELEKLQQQEIAAQLSRRNVKVAKKIRKTLKLLSDTYDKIQRKELEKNTIHIRAEQDLKRFRRLKGHAQVDEQDDVPPTLDNILPCGTGLVCEKTWERAEQFVNNYVTTGIPSKQDFMIIGKLPKKDDDISITISRIRNPGQPDILYMDLYCNSSAKGQKTCSSDKVSKIRKAFRTEVGGLAP